MPKPNVFITRTIPEQGITLLKKYCTIRVYPKDAIIPRRELLKGVRGCDALLCLLTDRIDKEVIDANPKLKIISNYAIGFNNIDVKYATEKGIAVTNTPGKAIFDAVAEHTFALMLALAKRIHEADHFTKRGKYQGWSPTLLIGTQLAGKTLGIVGLGKIGTDVAGKAVQGLGMNVVYHDVRRSVEFEKKYHARYCSLHDLLRKSDVVTLHVPLLPSTRHLIGAKELCLMKNTAFLINTARGGIVDEKALVRAIQRKEIAGCALDVFECETDTDHHVHKELQLKRYDNVILTPHIASATQEARAEMSKDAAENILAVLKGKKPKYLVNPEVIAR